MLRDGPGSAAYFVAYEVIKKSMIPEGKTAADLGVLPVLFAGGTNVCHASCGDRQTKD